MDTTIEVPGRGEVRLTFTRLRHGRGRSYHWFWTVIGGGAGAQPCRRADIDREGLDHAISYGNIVNDNVLYHSS
jgi:hypothetical protein